MESHKIPWFQSPPTRKYHEVSWESHRDHPYRPLGFHVSLGHHYPKPNHYGKSLRSIINYCVNHNELSMSVPWSKYFPNLTFVLMFIQTSHVCSTQGWRSQVWRVPLWMDRKQENNNMKQSNAILQTQAMKISPTTTTSNLGFLIFPL